jgi:hypothetical protein
LRADREAAEAGRQQQRQQQATAGSGTWIRKSIVLSAVCAEVVDQGLAGTIRVGHGSPGVGVGRAHAFEDRR